MCVGERERERENVCKREKEKERERENVCKRDKEKKRETRRFRGFRDYAVVATLIRHLML